MSVSSGHGVPGEDQRIFAFEEIRAAVETAHDVGMRVRTHVTGKRFILECVRAGVDILDHCDGLDEASTRWRRPAASCCRAFTSHV
jgi:imidazolonepropionase-like amidohydrolase